MIANFEVGTLNPTASLMLLNPQECEEGFIVGQVVILQTPELH